jgi:tetratricopeptide (TPR) repeat protein
MARNAFALPHGLTGEIIRLAGGNPFFIEEVVKSLFDQGVIVRREQGLKVTEKASAITIPATITDVLMARIDRLEEPTKHLLKVASVIGRSFSSRILSAVAGEVDDIPERLSFLSEIQILQPQERTGEVEYVFRHALAQEAAYASLLLSRRRELHLKVAHSIETIFSAKLPECYGMLAYHYSRAEDREKTEEYLIKAGEEALRSAASDEALHYYEDALQLYLKKSGRDADPEKVAMLEKNIGLALFNRGRYAEAVDQFDKALDYYWGELPKTPLSKAFRFLPSFVTFLLALYFPSRWFKRVPTQGDTEAVELFYKKLQALVVIDPRRFFVESFFFYATLVKFDPREFKMGIAIFAAASALFSFAGISLRVGRKILDYAKPRLTPDDVKQLIIYDIVDTQHFLLNGQWNEIAECDEDLAKRNLRIGETSFASQYYYWHGLEKIHQGHVDAARLMVTKLNEIAEAYDNDIYRLLMYLLNVHLLIDRRHMKEALAEVSRGIDLVRRNNWPLSVLTMYSQEALTHLSMKDTEKARTSLKKADQIRSEVKAAPIQLSFFYRSQFECYLQCLEDSLKAGDRKESYQYRKSALKSGKMLIRICRKAALYRTDSYRFMGVYSWLVHDRKSALGWWRRAIAEGERLGALPQLSRTYAEMGTRLCGIEQGSSERNTDWAKEALQKARTMFGELGLERDLEDLDSVVNRMGLY